MSQSLLILLNNSLTNYSNTDPNWYQFISDHKTYIISNSNLRNISAQYLQGVRFNMQAYLRSINYDPSCYWIIQLINNIPNDVYFTSGVSLIYVPPISVILNLYTSYITSKTASNT